MVKNLPAVCHLPFLRQPHLPRRQPAVRSLHTTVSQQHSGPSSPSLLLEFSRRTPIHPTQPTDVGTSPPPTAAVKAALEEPKGQIPSSLLLLLPTGSTENYNFIVLFWKKNICWFLVTSNRNANSSLAVEDIWTKWSHLGTCGLSHNSICCFRVPQVSQLCLLKLEVIYFLMTLESHERIS